MVKLILCTRCGVKVNREVGDVEDGFVCFACREGERGDKGGDREAQAGCLRAGGEGRVHGQREVIYCSTQTEAGVVTVCTTSQTEQGVTGGKGVVCEPGVSTQTNEVGCMAVGGG